MNPMDQNFNTLQFIPPGPIAAAWIDDSTTPMPFIRGPGGSGKTTSAVFRGPRWIMRHMPVCRDGVIRGRITIIRDNYRRLAETALKSWKLVFREDLPHSEFSGGQDRPVHHLIRGVVERSGQVMIAGKPLYPAARYPRMLRKVEIEVDFFAVGDHAIEEMLRGYETSYGWLNEADLLNDRVAPFLYSRTGRFPSKLMLPDELVAAMEEGRWSMPRQVCGDLNPPDVTHWVEKWDRSARKGFKLYKQPSGLSPQAENRKGKSLKEYEADLEVMDEYDAQRFVHGQPGFARDGIPVYAVPKDGVGGFRPSDHVAAGPIKVVRELPINLGFDAGGTPACAVTQTMPTGQFRMLREITTEPVTGPERFAEMITRLLVSEDFRGVPVGLNYGDPSAFYGADKEHGDLAWMQTVALAIGSNILPAPSNEPAIRIASLSLLMKQYGMFQVDPRCETTIGGLAAHYKIGKDKKGAIINGGRPVKNEYSHIVEALQYVALGTRGRAGVIEDAARAGRAGNVIPIIAGKRHDNDFDGYGNRT